MQNKKADTGNVRQEEKMSTAEKRKQCVGESDDSIKPSHEAGHSCKKSRMDDYFVKKAMETSSISLEQAGDDAGNE